MPTLTVKRGSRIFRLLTETTLYRTKDRARAERSWLMYRADTDGWFRVSLLGFLHSTVRLTLWVED